MAQINDIYCFGKFEIKLNNDEFWEVDLDEKEISFYGFSGFKTESKIEIINLKGKCKITIVDDICNALIMNSNSSFIYKLSNESPIFSKLISITRTELTDEGFDYMDLLSIEKNYVLVYEYGILLIGKNLDIVHKIDFGRLMVRPVIDGVKIIYKDLSETIVYIIKNEKIIKDLSIKV